VVKELSTPAVALSMPVSARENNTAGIAVPNNPDIKQKMPCFKVIFLILLKEKGRTNRKAKQTLSIPTSNGVKKLTALLIKRKDVPHTKTKINRIIQADRLFFI